MRDQAEKLRSLAKSVKNPCQICINKPTKFTRVITVTSGKGGVGKTNFTVNLGLALTRLNKKVIILDADLGLANVDVVLGLIPNTNLGEVMSGKKELTEVITEGPAGLKIIAGGSGVQELANLDDWQIDRFISSLSQLDGCVDIILIDTGAGLTKNVLSFVLAADEIVVVTTPEPTAFTDAYAIIKVIAAKNGKARINLVVNRAQTILEGEQTAKKLTVVSEHFLKFKLNNLGIIVDDPNVSSAVKKQKPFLLAYPGTVASRCLNEIALALLGSENQNRSSQGIQGFFSKIVKFLR